jgi:Ni,Fe-hydrogenase III large subunit
LIESIESISAEVATLRTIYDEHAGLRDRFVGAGVVTPALAAKLGLTGLAGRASGQKFDLRCDLPCDPYGDLAPQKTVRTEGDVAARVAVRFDEVAESTRLMRRILGQLPTGLHHVALSIPNEGALGVGMIEGWRGPIFLALEAGGSGMIRRCHPHDPSWQNWPVIEHAIIDNIVPDFPLINKSFNLSYSGHDL